PVAMNSSTTWPLTPARRPEIALRSASAPRLEPLVQAVPAVAEPVPRSLIGPGDESVEGHGHVKNGCGHGVSFPRLPSTKTVVCRDTHRSARHGFAALSP